MLTKKKKLLHSSLVISKDYKLKANGVCLFTLFHSSPRNLFIQS